MRAKTGYRQQKPGREHWDERRQAYTTVGRHLHRYFLMRTVRKTRTPNVQEEQNECDGTCPFWWPEVWAWNATTNRYELPTIPNPR